MQKEKIINLKYLLNLFLKHLKEETTINIRIKSHNYLNKQSNPILF